MTTADKIIQYLYDGSKGVINISPAHANNIIDIVVNNFGTPHTAFAKMSRYNWVTGGWELIRTLTTTDEEIKHQVIAALEKGPAEKSFKYECYNSAGEFEGVIFTIDYKLFK